jgi:hypothetical protein
MQELPVIYGSRAWLVEALYGYIEYMVKNCRLRSDLELQIRLRQFHQSADPQSWPGAAQAQRLRRLQAIHPGPRGAWRGR